VRGDPVTGDGPHGDRPAGQPAGAGPVRRGFELFLGWSRLLVLVAVVFLLADAAASFIYGSDILVRTAAGVIGRPARIGGRLGILLVVMDAYLVGATLMVAAFGLYGLFVIRDGPARGTHWLPNWLAMRDLDDLKARVVSMLILVAAVTFVDIAVESRDEVGILYLGLGISVVIAALTAFLRFGRQRAP